MRSSKWLWMVVTAALYAAACETTSGTGSGGGGSPPATVSSGSGGSGGAAASSSSGGAGGATTATVSSGSGGAAASSSSGGAGGATTATASSGAGGASSGTGGSAGAGLPCDVLALLQARCWSCHGNAPYSKTSIKLLTYAQLTAPSDKDPAQTNAQRSLDRMQDVLSPMPPGPFPVAPSGKAAMAAWIAGGYPADACPDVVPDPYAAPSQCTSGMQLDPNQQEGPEMNPGRACNACHEQVNAEGATAPLFTFAGTVFPTAHEPDDCVSTGFGGAVVEITDAHGTVVTVPVGAAGNFSYEDTTLGFTAPYKARVLFQGRERTMDTPQLDGDCNGCHGQAGTMDAPGRILLP